MIHVVWEHLIAVHGPRFTQRKFDRRLSWGRVNAALSLWVTNSTAVEAIWRLWDEGSAGVGVVTYLPEMLWLPVSQRLADESIPHLRFIPTTPQEMAHKIALRPDITQLIDGDPEHALTYGPKGIHIPSDQAHLIGKVA